MANIKLLTDLHHNGKYYHADERLSTVKEKITDEQVAKLAKDEVIEVLPEDKPPKTEK